MIIEKDLKGYFKWIVVNENLVIVDPKWISEYETYVLDTMDKPVNF